MLVEVDHLLRDDAFAVGVIAPAFRHDLVCLGDREVVLDVRELIARGWLCLAHRVRAKREACRVVGPADVGDAVGRGRHGSHGVALRVVHGELGAGEVLGAVLALLADRDAAILLVIHALDGEQVLL